MSRGWGPVVSVLQTAGLTLTFPEDLTDGRALFSVPLGLLPEPEISMVRYGVNAGSRLVLSRRKPRRIPSDRITSILLENEIEKVLQSLRHTIKIQSQLMLVELVPPEYEGAVLAAPGESSHEVNMKLGEARMQLDADAAQWKLQRRGDFGSLLRWWIRALGWASRRRSLFPWRSFSALVSASGINTVASSVIGHLVADSPADTADHCQHRCRILGLESG